MTLSLIVVLPLISAVLCSIIPNKRWAWLCTFITPMIVLVFSVYTFSHVYKYGPISYYMGGWLAPYGIELKADLLSCIFSVLISAIATITMPYALFAVEQQIPEKKIGSFYTCFLLSFTGLLGMVISHDVFNIYVFLELSSLASYSLIAMGNTRSANSAFEYLIIGTIGATFYLLGIGLLYMMTGTLNISDLHSKLLLLQDNQVIILGMILVFTGLAIKVALFPFHKWMVESYSNAPHYISTFFSATATKVAMYLMIRFIYSVFGGDFILSNVGSALHILSLFAIIAGSICALRENTLLRILPYSSVSQIGYIVLGISLNSKLALTAALLHLIFHSITKPALFMISQIEQSKKFSMPIFAILGCSMIGIPVTAGFTSKWYLITAAIQSGYFFPVVVMAIGSVMTFLYMWKSIGKIDWRDHTTNKIMLLPSLILTIMVLTLGIYSKPLFDIVGLVVEQLL